MNLAETLLPVFSSYQKDESWLINYKKWEDDSPIFQEFNILNNEKERKIKILEALASSSLYINILATKAEDYFNKLIKMRIESNNILNSRDICCTRIRNYNDEIEQLLKDKQDECLESLDCFSKRERMISLLINIQENTEKLKILDTFIYEFIADFNKALRKLKSVDLSHISNKVNTAFATFTNYS